MRSAFTEFRPLLIRFEGRGLKDDVRKTKEEGTKWKKRGRGS